MPRWKIDVDAAVSDEFVVVAPNLREAKKRAVKKFCKVKNFRFIVIKLKPGERAEDVWL